MQFTLTFTSSNIFMRVRLSQHVARVRELVAYSIFNLQDLATVSWNYHIRR